MTDTTRDLIQRLTERLDLLHCQYNVPNQSALIDEAHAYLDQPEPEGPTESDLSVLFYRHVGEGSEVGFGDAIKEVLARWGRPAIQPIPVSERPWEREGWCDSDGCCWGFDADSWSFEHRCWGRAGSWTHALPHYALPIPEPTTQEEN